jgi:6-phosphogluconolactonase (cycloisomerase 2 family)
MKTSRTIAASGALAAATLASCAASAFADRAVFVQTDNLARNRIVAYDRQADGSLTRAGVYDTGGRGGALEGSVVDHLASQGSLVYDRLNRMLYAANAGSDTISVFAVLDDRLALRQVLPSGGRFPVSIAVHGGLVYVLNALEGGSLQGFRVSDGALVPLPDSSRALGLDPGATPQFTSTPGEVGFSPDGSQLVVTTKANGDDVDVFRVDPSGRLAQATVNPLPGAVPFALGFDERGHLLVSEAGPGALASFRLRDDGSIAQIDSQPTGQLASCWVTRAGRRFYVSNTGSGSVTGFQAGLDNGLLGEVSRTSTDAGPVDAAVPGGGGFLYVQTGGEGIVDEFAIEPDGTLREVGSVKVPDAVGGEGIAAE